MTTIHMDSSVSQTATRAVMNGGVLSCTKTSDKDVYSHSIWADRKQHPAVHDALRGQHRHPARFERDDMDIPHAAGKIDLDHGLRTQGKGCLTRHMKQPLSEIRERSPE
ncbi:hypothetical protein ABIB90_006082 [Bradyrhizobium sp. JR4.1]|uniref:hypothetical protein n=1 Tax=unclassified Bradyrhizobium TaxID=2631580 RepID=UPI00339097DA